jgi:hypothetical protein
VGNSSSRGPTRSQLIRKPEIRAIYLLGALALSSCSTISPKGFHAAPPAVSTIAAAAAVTVVPMVRVDNQARFNANGITYALDRNEFSTELARLLEQSLAGAGVKIGGDRTLEVAVVYMDFLFQGPCLLDYDVRLGSEHVFGSQSRGDSWNFATACRLAMESAAKNIATDARTREFLERPE